MASAELATTEQEASRQEASSAAVQEGHFDTDDTESRRVAASFTLTLPERLDRASASVLAAAHERIGTNSVQRLSFERTRRLETAGLEALRLFCKRAYENNASVRLERLQPEVAAVLALCGFAALCLLLPAAEESSDE